MPNFICTTCGTQFAESDQTPANCDICEDERQFVGWNGQQWTILDDLRQSHRNVVRLEELGLCGIGMEPSFAIGHMPVSLQGRAVGRIHNQVQRERESRFRRSVADQAKVAGMVLKENAQESSPDQAKQLDLQVYYGGSNSRTIERRTH